jgi:hypothetical protein
MLLAQHADQMDGELGRHCRSKVHWHPTHSAKKPRNGWGTAVYSKSENALNFLNRRLNLFRQFGWDLLNSVRALCVCGALREHVFHRFAGRLEIAIDTYIATSDRLCHKTSLGLPRFFEAAQAYQKVITPATKLEGVRRLSRA